VSGLSRRLGLGTTSCLARSQLSYLLIGGEDAGAAVVFGIEPEIGAGGEAHAWIELDGRPIGESADVQTAYLAFERPLLPSSTNDHAFDRRHWR